MKTQPLKLLLTLIGTVWCMYLSAQKNSLPDSLLSKLKAEKDPTAKIYLCINLGLNYADRHFELAESLFSHGVNLATSEKNNNLLAETYGYWSYLYSYKGDYETCAEKIAIAKKLTSKITDTQIMLKVMMAESDYYDKTEQLDKAIALRKKEIQFASQHLDSNNLAAILHNIGISYHKKNMDKVADSLVSLAYNINQKIKNNGFILNNLSMLASIQARLGNLNMAIEYNIKALAIAEEIKDDYPTCLIYLNLGSTYTLVKAFDKAKYHLDKGYELSVRYKFREWRQNAYKFYTAYYKAINDYKTATTYYDLYIGLKDSILNETTAGKLADLEFELNQKKVQLLNEAKAKTDAKLKEQKAINEKQSFQFYAVACGLIVLAICMIFVYRSFLQKKRSNQKILEQNELLEIKNKEVAQQKILVEEKHKEITDSINYAERIQRSFLATKNLLDENLKNYFVFFQPKDIVSGDFYWASKLSNGYFAYVTADSTGHGVPGAIMSIANIACLKESITKGKTQAGDILNETRKLVIEYLKNDGSADGGKDGMDVALILLNAEKTKLQYASANNVIWILRNKEIIELQPDKMPVGKHDKDQIPFTQHEFELEKGDVIYTLSDGMADQFGGPRGKKFKYSRLKEFFITNEGIPLHEQKEKLAETFHAWKGDLEQVDDVCIIGVKV